MQLKSAKELIVYQKAFSLAMEVFSVSRGFRPDERFSLTDQIRRSSRSVCANLREAWAKRRYSAHFASKLTDADAENSETDTWLDFAAECGYLPKPEHERLRKVCSEVGSMLGGMIKYPNKFLISDL